MRYSFIQRVKTAFIIALGGLVIAGLAFVLTPFYVLSGVIGVVGGMALWEWARVSRGMIRGVGLAFIGGGCVAFEWVLLTSGWQGLMSVIGTAALTDTLAYTGGSLMGGAKLCPSVSPQKTWSGALTALILAPLLSAWGQGLFRPGLAFYPRWVFSLCLCLAAQLGDLLESFAKRRVGIKDTGSILPGHGGVLDRIDSWLMAAMVAVLVGGRVFS